MRARQATIGKQLESLTWKRISFNFTGSEHAEDVIARLGFKDEDVLVANNCLRFKNPGDAVMFALAYPNG